MINKPKKRWKLGERLIEEGDILLVKYNPAEHVHREEKFVFDGDMLVNKDNVKLEVDSIYINNMVFK